MRFVMLPCILRVPVEGDEVLHGIELELPDGTLLPLDEEDIVARLWVTRMPWFHEHYPELGREFIREHLEEPERKTP